MGGKKFLEENRKRPGVVSMPSGLQYKVLREGTGDSHPFARTECETHYVGTTPSMTPDALDKPDSEWKPFFSSHKKGTQIYAPDVVIKGWSEAVQLMVGGDMWQLYIPAHLGYGFGGAGAHIKGGDVLIFNMELIKILGRKKPAKRCDVGTLRGCSKDEIAFIEEQGTATAEKRKAELERLDDVNTTEMRG